MIEHYNVSLSASVLCVHPVAIEASLVFLLPRKPHSRPPAPPCCLASRQRRLEAWVSTSYSSATVCSSGYFHFWQLHHCLWYLWSFMTSPKDGCLHFDQYHQSEEPRKVRLWPIYKRVYFSIQYTYESISTFSGQQIVKTQYWKGPVESFVRLPFKND